MSKLSYIARDNAGNKVTGSEEASSSEDLILRLQSKNLIVVNILSESQTANLRVKSESTTSGVKLKHKHFAIKEEDLVLFCRQLATLLGAGVTILKSLEIILKQIGSVKFYSVIRNMIKDMEAGLSLHEAMAKHSSVFSDLWVNLVESGEASGNLAVVLNRLASYLERNAEFKKKIISALMYPVILLCAGMGALFFLTVKIIPTFAELFKGFNLELPLLTQIIVSISDFLRKFILPIIVILIVINFMIRAYIKTKSGRLMFEKYLLKIPLLGQFTHSLIMERFSSEMSTLIESGVPILYSLEISEHSVGNLVMAGVIRQIKENVREGRPLSQQLEKSGFFEPMVVQMVMVGEEIGELAQMFRKINTYYEEYVSTFLTRFTTLFEPLILVFMGGIIGIMVIGLFLPIFKLASIGG